jgi:hypothetical protein
MMSDMHLAELIARDRIEEARARAARRRLLDSANTARPRLRVMLGFALIRLGQWLAGRPARLPEPTRARVTA